MEVLNASLKETLLAQGFFMPEQSSLRATVDAADVSYGLLTRLFKPGLG